MAVPLPLINEMSATAASTSHSPLPFLSVGGCLDGAELSVALGEALEGRAPMTPALMGEWRAKRPCEYRAHKEAAIIKALRELA
jgi:hypothetical protein